MTKPNNKSTVKEMKDYIRKNKLNQPKVKLGMRKAEMIAALKKIGHFEDSETTTTPKKVEKKVEKKEEPKKKEGVDFSKIKKILRESDYNTGVRSFNSNNFRKKMTVVKGKLRVGTYENDVNKLIKDTNKLFKSNKLIYDNVIFATNPYTPNPRTKEQDGVYRTPTRIYQGKVMR